jgi:hypothetical protein
MPMLRKAAHKFKAHLDSHRAEIETETEESERRSVALSSAGDDGSFGLGDASLPESGGGLDGSFSRRRNSLKANRDQMPSGGIPDGQRRGHDGNVTMLLDDFTAFESIRLAGGPHKVQQHRELRPKLKFSTRGAALPCHLDAGLEASSSKVNVPAFLEHECIERNDLPLTTSSVATVGKHRSDIHDRKLAGTLGLEWAPFEKALGLCEASLIKRDPMGKVKEAMRLRMGIESVLGGATISRAMVPILPLSTLTTPTPSFRLPETARETERRAVSRLLGDTPVLPPTPTRRQHSAR